MSTPTKLGTSAAVQAAPDEPHALQFAADADHPVYDAIYALAARRHAANLLTVDKRLRDLCKRARIDCECFAF